MHLLPNLFQPRVPLLNDFVWHGRETRSQIWRLPLLYFFDMRIIMITVPFNGLAPIFGVILIFSGQTAGHYLRQTLYGIDILTKPRYTHPTRIVLGLRVMWTGCYNP